MQYDYIIVGGGASGLSLAVTLAKSALRNSSILIVEQSPKLGMSEAGAGDADCQTPPVNRTWAFWSKTPTLFDAAVYRSWNHLLVTSRRTKRMLHLGPYRYNVIRGEDFYRFAHAELRDLPNVEFVRGRVERVEDSTGGARVHVAGPERDVEYEGRWVFDSRFKLSDFHPDPRRYECLKMSFLGWEIETPRASFDPRFPAFLDFRTPQRGEARFCYILPYSSSYALVEFVACGKEAPGPAEQDEALRRYIGDVLCISDYRVVAQEQESNPMTDYTFPRREGAHIMTIGAPAGRLKPTTGFAFTRIQRDSAAIVRSLLEHGHPFSVPPSRTPYRLCDSLMLRAMAHYGPQVGSLFVGLFRIGSTRRILTFLDEEGAPF